MSISTDVLNGMLPLLGVAIGSGATLVVQRSSAREARRKSAADARQAQRTELKSAVSAFLKAAQDLQSQLYAREHGRDIPDLISLAEDLWLAHAQVVIVCSEQLADALQTYAEALNRAARHEEEFPDWWEFVKPHKRAFLYAVRAELRQRDSTAVPQSE